ncbi:protein Mpv17-like isoform X1 [Patiria miniata]|uniref:Mitochondrial inner membrane protein Mpv17 n=1 Tax=Patiria miniata TaxID=46514 RepID=A0A913ZL99_PATMI|nr:protein Mpv17-like isoform X1 [Patiria miniata]
MLWLWRAYTKFLQAHPFKAQAANTCLLMGLGDIICQQAIEKAGLKKHNVVRTVRQASFGLFIGGPLLFTWYSTLDKFVKGTAAIKTLKCVALDQALMAPTFITVFYTLIGLTSGLSSAEVKDKLKQNFKTTLINNYKVWPAAQIINFYFVPLQHRVLAVNCVALFWNTYLSWMANSRQELVETVMVDETPASKTSPET